jgi:predicted transcriptional regulator
VAQTRYIGSERFMSTTTIRLPDELKARVAEAAEQSGTTSHNFILEAIAEKVDMVERRGDFDAVADQRYAQFLESGKSIPWEKARSYLEDRLAGKTVKRPVARKLDRWRDARQAGPRSY